MNVPPEVWEVIKIIGGGYFLYVLNKFDRSQRAQVEINKDLYEKHNGLASEFHELRGEHKARRCTP